MLRDQAALITGASRGIGKAIALKLAKAGCNIAVSDVLDAGETVKEIKDLGVNACSFIGNVALFSDAEQMVDKAYETFGRLDILVNNAGITRDGLLMRMSEEDWDAVLSVNLKGVFNCTRAAVKYMMKQKYGRIINISSVVGIIGNSGQANYAASKAGVVGLTKTMARELATRNITVNAIAPGFIKSKMTESLSEEAKNKLLAAIPAGSLGEPEDVAIAVAFLASPDARYITGQVLCVDGGMAM
ncbi:MAG: 3-oxoacyl-[acyl-carrier-protein] reductase [Bacillota bacterium]